ncbi:hypothetical protein MITS9509_01991 [Synechococcus sp. MIT S9509]|uniref:hypothetical protein n=1 Tax=unclassified Synechococcus TaxID=2626047 RepID=UPI0007BB43F4|nr:MULTISPECIES: hypothetical protein [unclassified Synechococcus]KZR86007.1 hypothetical protein MITS9504_01790 [Synechococcus sp. MIT S9504]KZR92070.1 hypothetical protein MITS9509_01991 [Synechococcus sp. MIT S9509]
MAERDIISTIAELREAILNYEVKEVSSDLVFNFSGDKSLYPQELGFAWTASSATLYDLLVLNQRFQSSSVDLSKNDPNELKIDLKVINALERGVGFGFGYQNFLSVDELENTVYPVFDVVENTSPIPITAVIFDKTEGPFESYDSSGNEITISRLTIDQRMPTQTFWRELLGKKIAENVDNPIPIPGIVFSEITKRYANSEPVTTNYGGVVGIKDPLFFGAGGGSSVLKPDGQPPFTEGLKSADFDQWNTFPQAFVSSDVAFELMKSVNRSFGANGGPNFSLDQASGIFYEEFLRSRLEEYVQIENQGGNVESRQAEIISELVVLVRSFENFQLGSSSLNTGSNGEGFSNAANPLVGRSYEDITLNDDFYLDTFMGQEFIIDNLIIPDPGEFAAAGWLSLNSSSDGADPNMKTYPSDGWFDLDEEKSLKKSDIGGDLNDYKSNYVINDDTIKCAVFARDSVSSDTLSAAELTSEFKNTLQASTRVDNDAFENVRIDDLLGFGGDFLPDEFSTFISMAGGVDRVTGSRFADVILGPDLSSLHGTMTFDSGEGDDLVRPGRGQSLWLLGEGRDVIAFSKGDLFGQSIFLDYSMGEDVLIYEKGITAEIDANDRSILYLKDDSSDAMKTILLSGSSDLFWSEQSIQACF